MRTLASIALCSAAAPALAQPFIMQSHTIDSGGASSITAGPFTLGSAIGQPSAGSFSAPPYEISSGFWQEPGNEPPGCYPNCDGSTGTPSLTANDFQCFLNRFAAADPYANCDGSTGTPSLTANDFQCFLNSYAAGCT